MGLKSKQFFVQPRHGWQCEFGTLANGVWPYMRWTGSIGHSEEHLVLETDRAADFPVGSPLYGIPWHVCPTVALHNEAVVVRNGRADERWQIVARARTLTI